MMLLPCASRPRARTRTSNADSLLMRDILSATFMGLLQGNPVGGENPAAAFAQIAASALDRALDPLLASCNPLRFGVQFREFLLRDAAQPCRKRRVIGEAVQQR